MGVDLPTLKCKRCGYEWIPRHPDVRMCPKCKSVRWDGPRQDEKKS